MKDQQQEVIKASHLILSFSIIGVIALFLICIWKRKDTFDYLGRLFNVENIWSNLAIGGGLGILLAIVALALVKWTGTKIPGEDNESLKELMKRPDGAILIGVLPGIFEELLFRGFLVPFILSFTNAIWAVIITTIIFWGIHVPQYKNKVILNLNVIMLSVITSVLLIKTETLWAPIFVHVVYNYLVTLAVQKKIITV